MKLPRHAELWFLPYVRSESGEVRASRARSGSGSLSRIITSPWAWEHRWRPLLAESHAGAIVGRKSQPTPQRDANGQPPQYSFFYPQEEYRRDLLDGIAEMVRLGVGDVEVHLHHDRETPREPSSRRFANTANVSRRIMDFCGSSTAARSSASFMETGRSITRGQTASGVA